MSEEVKVPSLYKEADDLVNQIVSEQDPSKVKDLTDLFMANRQKKNIARLDKLSKLVDLMDEETISRVTTSPEEISNKDLVSFINVTQNSINNIEQSINQTPIIQINNQKNEININDTGLNRESREKVLATVMKILESSKEKEVIDVEIENESEEE